MRYNQTFCVTVPAKANSLLLEVAVSQFPPFSALVSSGLLRFNETTNELAGSSLNLRFTLIIAAIVWQHIFQLIVADET
jgi:hypothetical protein